MFCEQPFDALLAAQPVGEGACCWHRSVCYAKPHPITNAVRGSVRLRTSMSLNALGPFPRGRDTLWAVGCRAMTSVDGLERARSSRDARYRLQSESHDDDRQPT